MSQGSQSLVKHLFHGFFALFGIRVCRIPKCARQGAWKYFNTGERSPVEENSRDLYDRFYGDHEALEQYYDEQRLTFYAEVCQQLRNSGLELDQRDVLDVGCGTGHLLSELQRWWKPRIAGCDFSEEAMNFSRERFPGCHFFTHDIYQPLPGTYDLVLCTEVLEHLEQPFAAIQNLLNATRPGGFLVVTVPDGRIDHLNQHINFWSPESWKVFVERECPRCKVVTSQLKTGRHNFALIQRCSL
jgi:SAM-dependent methyltransferase